MQTLPINKKQDWGLGVPMENYWFFGSSIWPAMQRRENINNNPAGQEVLNKTTWKSKYAEYIGIFI